MKLLVALTLALGAATAAFADVDSALDRHVLPALKDFAEASDTLAQTAARDCRPDAVRPAFQATFDAWMQIADLRLGPSETGALSIYFWPDTRGFTQRSIARLVAEEDPVGRDPTAYRDVSIAARGLFALEMLLYDPEFADYDTGSYTCALVTTISADLNHQADDLDAAWTDRFANILRTAGEDGNATYLTSDEALRALYTQILSSLEFSADQRLGQPMGRFDRPRPARAEARRSARSLRNVVLANGSAYDLAASLVQWDLPLSKAALAQVHQAASRISDPAFQDVGDPQARLRVEILQQSVRALRTAIETEIGVRLGITPGFNAQDGD
ncbi:imelysin family protein [Thioclava sp.]|uniref:imelysin family protein n=1 Tax=Thioclava sp. TaxID=1933450 RepID=UPI003AA94520